MIWYDMIWYDMIWYDMVQDDMIWHDMIQDNMIWHDMIWPDMMQDSTIWFELIWYNTVYTIYHDVIWYDINVSTRKSEHINLAFLGWHIQNLCLGSDAMRCSTGNGRWDSNHFAFWLLPPGHSWAPWSDGFFSRKIDPWTCCRVFFLLCLSCFFCCFGNWRSVCL